MIRIGRRWSLRIICFQADGILAKDRLGPTFIESGEPFLGDFCQELLGEQFLCTADPFRHLYTIGAPNRTIRAIAATPAAGRGGQFKEFFSPQGELAISFRVHAAAQYFGDWQVLRAGSLAPPAHPAILRPELLQRRRQQLVFPFREGLRHGPDVFLHLIKIGCA